MQSNKDISIVLLLRNGIPETVDSYENPKDAEDAFASLIRKHEAGISDEDVELCLDNGAWDNNSGIDICLMSAQLHPTVRRTNGSGPQISLAEAYEYVGAGFKDEVFVIRDNKVVSEIIFSGLSITDAVKLKERGLLFNDRRDAEAHLESISPLNEETDRKSVV